MTSFSREIESPPIPSSFEINVSRFWPSKAFFLDYLFSIARTDELPLLGLAGVPNFLLAPGLKIVVFLFGEF